jgi:hypothetical protein
LGQAFIHFDEGATKIEMSDETDVGRAPAARAGAVGQAARQSAAQGAAGGQGLTVAALVVCFFVAWAVGSLAVLVSRFTPWLRNHDLIGLLPQWKFFAPIPGRGDFHLLYRDVYAHGVTDWTEIAFAEEGGWWTCLWNPRRRESKAVFDAARELPAYLTPEWQESATISVPYLTFLTYVSGQARTVPPLRTQFLLMYSEAALEGGRPQVSMLSHAHAWTS